MKIISACFLFLISCNSYSQVQQKLLLRSYQENSLELLCQFLENWKNELVPLSDSEIALLNDTIENAYKVYKAFVSKQVLDSCLASEFLATTKYVCVQNSLIIQIYKPDSYAYNQIISGNANDKNKNDDWINNYSSENNIVLEINNFRPQISLTNLSTLIQSDRYDEILNFFLMEMDKKTDERNPLLGLGGTSREAFIRRYANIHTRSRRMFAYRGDFFVNKILFDSEMKFAAISTNGATFIFKNNEKGWLLYKTQRFFID